MSDNLIRQRADAHFSKLPGVEDKNAMSEYEAGAPALADKIARLRQLRLARDAAAQAAPPAAVPVKKARRKKKPSAASLSDWLNARANAHVGDKG